MTESQSYYRLFSSDKNISLKRFLSSNTSPAKKPISKQEHKKIVNISNSLLDQELQKIQWRIKTQFPIVKIVSYTKLTRPFKDKGCHQKTTVQLFLEPINLTMSSLNEIPFFKVLYLLKETIVGVQRLSNQYGYFLLKSSMIGINSSGKCKIWHNSEFHINRVQYPCQTQEETISSVSSIFIMKTKKSSKSFKFYQQLKLCQTFCESLQLLKKYSLENKIGKNFSFFNFEQFVTPVCSPRKFVARPPSCFRNPESLQNISEKFQCERKIEKEERQFLKRQSHQNNEPTQKFQFFKNKSVRSIENSMISQKKRTQREFPTYLKKGKQKINSFGINSIQKIHQLSQIQSIHEGNSDIDESNAEVERLEVTHFGFVIPELARNSNLQKQLCISSLLMDERENDMSNDDIVQFFNKNLESTFDNEILTKRKSEITSIFQHSFKHIDTSFDAVLI